MRGKSERVLRTWFLSVVDGWAGAIAGCWPRETGRWHPIKGVGFLRVYDFRGYTAVVIGVG